MLEMFIPYRPIGNGICLLAGSRVPVASSQAEEREKAQQIGADLNDISIRCHPIRARRCNASFHSPDKRDLNRRPARTCTDRQVIPSVADGFQRFLSENDILELFDRVCRENPATSSRNFSFALR
jgi:hypothetical protein